MTGQTRLVADDAYEQMGAAYQCVQVALLDEALRDNGIEDPKLREKICGSFIFELGIFHDQRWFKPADEAMRPLLCFTAISLEVEPNVESLGTIYAPSSGFSFHEYAFGNVSIYFEGEPGAKIEVGSLGPEPEAEDEADDETDEV